MKTPSRTMHFRREGERRAADSGCNMGCKTLFAEWGKLPLKLTCPAGTSTCPATLFNKGCIGLCPKHYLPSGASQGLVQLAPLPFFCQIHLQRGKWLCCILRIARWNRGGSGGEISEIMLSQNELIFNPGGLLGRDWCLTH